jgi:predicted DNA-binding transcriptional regulator AlpA
MTVACSAIATKETSSSEDCPRGKKRNGCGTIRIAGKLVRNSYAICKPVPGPMSRLNQPSRPRRRQRAEVPTGGESDGLLLVPGEDKPQPHKSATNTAPPTIANPEATAPATAAAGDEIVIDGRRLLGERRVAEMLGYSPRTLQRWRTEGKGPASTKIGRKVFYELNDLQEWIDRGKIR